MVVKPFIKWVGGKSSLLPILTQHLPPQTFTGEITDYIEPFLGGGALFLWLIQNSPIKKFYLLDSNHALINAWRVVKYLPKELIEQLKVMEELYLSCDDVERTKYFYSVRTSFNQYLSSGIYKIIPFAAEFIFLNKTCFNGLYRVNKRGTFNTPHGSNLKPNISNEQGILEVSKLLNNETKKVSIIYSDFTSFSLFSNESSLTYFDPPYRPISAASFTNYSINGFNETVHIDLAKKFTESKGHKILSNSYTEDNFVNTFYPKAEQHIIRCARSVNCKAESRGKIKEILLTQYN